MHYTDQLYNALCEMMDAMKPAADEDARKQRLSTAIAEVVRLGEAIPDDADKMLKHYMSNRSYQKALDLLQEGRPTTQTPSCGSAPS